VRALWSPRAGGISLPPFDSLNLGSHVGDDPELVEQNRNSLARKVGARPVYLNQMHGTDIVELQTETIDGLAADGAYTGCSGVACVVMAADCLPILLCNRAGTRVAALHAGWRGLAGREGRGILEAFHGQIMPQTTAGCAQDATEWIAWLGPCIGPQTFEVGAEVRSQFVGHQDGAVRAFVPLSNGKYLANLPLLARQRLETLGILAISGNDGSARWCTATNPSHFFSYRRDRVTGRHAACIWLE
jgi:YfiH family protein